MRRFSILFALILAGTCVAKWARPNLDVPISRLISNALAKIGKNPKDAVAAYHLGRLHSMAFAETKGNVELYGTENDYQFPAWTTVKVTKEGDRVKLTKAELDHLRQSLIYYRKATELDSKNGLYRLGLAWMMEQAAPFASHVGKLPWAAKPLTRRQYIDEALKMYWAIYNGFVATDLKSEGHLMGVQDVYVSEDAGAAILRLSPGLESRKRTEIAQNLKKLSQKSVGITPIIFPLNRTDGFASLLRPNRRVKFDLAGDGHSRNWSWVGANAGILVWDPRQTGDVSSGRQLFGSSTFWLFFSNGYDALASLDNDRNGMLQGKELSGIAVWSDLNENGKSEAGEVRPAKVWHISGIVTRPTLRNSLLMAQGGIQFTDGGAAASYDWEPVSIAR